ncbi:MAG: MTAP family purine nucleoside phosphorylase [Thermaerobacter sp.]|jgi:5'-methylthioadenosine phosphorylase|nr:MTAP family purine nucleoside phosphorylase [Thermaerobacter sp.]
MAAAEPRRAVPAAELGFIGGSSTFAGGFPEDLADPRVAVLGEAVYATPYGDSPPMKLFTLEGRRVLTCRMHGWRRGVSRADASRQVFWVLREAGVRRILVEGGVGSVSQLLDPGDLLVCSDYLDLSQRRDVSLGGDYLLVMRQALCPELREVLLNQAEGWSAGRVFRRGVYAVTDGRHFESPSEVQALARLGADVVGQSLCPEVYLAREIGACYARVDLVVNYGEGMVQDWSHDLLRELFHGQAQQVGRLMLAGLAAVPATASCGCRELRHETLLREKGTS